MALAGMMVLLLAAGFSVETQRAARLEHVLNRERASNAATRLVLQREVQAAAARSTTLESDLRTIEEEADRLYDVVRAMRTLGEQLRERVGLTTPVIDPLPALPARSTVGFTPVSYTEAPSGASIDGPGTPVGPASPGSAVAPGTPALDSTRTDSQLARQAVSLGLPANTGPWPAEVLQPAALIHRSDRVGLATELISRQWDSWQQLGQAIDVVLGQRSQATKPSIWPVRGIITSTFGWRGGFWGSLAYHTGLDVAVPIGTPVAATAQGTVVFSGVRSGYGYTVEIAHAGGLMSVYGHLSRLIARPGQQVFQGQIVALSGNSGVSTGPHVHYELRLKGVPVDPWRYL